MLHNQVLLSILQGSHVLRSYCLRGKVLEAHVERWDKAAKKVAQQEQFSYHADHGSNHLHSKNFR